jgi:hypothetical protein
MILTSDLWMLPRPSCRSGTGDRQGRTSPREPAEVGGYALHGMTLAPAYPVSLGCVRMTVPTMDRMWSSLWVGMPVAIYRL